MPPEDYYLSADPYTKPTTIIKGDKVFITNIDTGHVVELGNSFIQLSTTAEETAESFSKMKNEILKHYQNPQTIEVSFTDDGNVMAEDVSTYLVVWDDEAWAGDYENNLADLSKSLPAMSVSVENPPCTCEKGSDSLRGSLRGLIMHLNDYHKWSREDIADWIDLWAVENSVDISF